MGHVFSQSSEGQQVPGVPGIGLRNSLLLCIHPDQMTSMSGLQRDPILQTSVSMDEKHSYFLTLHSAYIQSHMVSLSTVAEHVNIAPCPYPTLSRRKVVW